MQRYFLKQPLEVNQQIELEQSVAKHWIRVMRATAGAEAELVDQNGQLFLGKLQSEETANVKIVQQLESHSELPVDVTLIMGLPKQDKAEWIVQKATELGATRLIFFQADWSVAQWKSNRVANKLERLAKIATGAAEQSHRTRVPEVTFEKKLETILNAYSGKLLVAYEESAKAGEKSALVTELNDLQNGDQLAVVTGPEGGISPAEIELLEGFNGTKVGLGPRIMRTETAPLYFLSAVSVITELGAQI